LEALYDYASPFQSEPELEASLSPLIAALKDLGLENLGDLRRLKSPFLGARFGSDAALLLSRIEGDFAMAWPRFIPEEKLEESCNLFSPENPRGSENLESLSFSLKQVLDRTCARLRARGLRASALALRLNLEHRAPRSLNFNLALPQGSAMELLKVLRERLDSEFQMRPLAAPVASLKLEIIETAPGLGSQAHFFNNEETEREAWNSLITRLSQKLGPDQVFLAELVQCYLPEKAWRKIIKEAEPKESPVLPAPSPSLRPEALAQPERPSRLLSKPLPFKKPLKRLSGLERIEGGWWEDGYARDYFQAETEEGRRLWVYTQVASPQATTWVHGAFD
jgi:protein ImuB